MTNNWNSLRLTSCTKNNCATGSCSRRTSWTLCLAQLTLLGEEHSSTSSSSFLLIRLAANVVKYCTPTKVAESRLRSSDLKGWIGTFLKTNTRTITEISDKTSLLFLVFFTDITDCINGMKGKLLGNHKIVTSTRRAGVVALSPSKPSFNWERKLRERKTRLSRCHHFVMLNPLRHAEEDLAIPFLTPSKSSNRLKSAFRTSAESKKSCNFTFCRAGGRRCIQIAD